MMLAPEAITSGEAGFPAPGTGRVFCFGASVGSTWRLHLKPGSVSRPTPPPSRPARLPSRVVAHALRIAAREIGTTRRGSQSLGERACVATPTVAAFSIDSGLTTSRFREAAAEFSTAAIEFRITTIKLRITAT